MAKRHKADDDENQEEFDFIPPEFDEDAFIHKEMVSFHTTVTLFLAGIVAALASWGAFAAMDGGKTGWLFGLLIMALTFAFLRPLFRLLNVDISHWARREWMGTAFLMFFAWLAFFIMFINPPISDFADPDVVIYTNPSAAAIGDDLVIDLFYTDNGKIVDRDFSLTGPVTASYDDVVKISGSHYQYVLTNATAGEYYWTASGEDAKGHITSHNGTVVVSSKVLDVRIGDLTDPGDELIVRVPDALNIYAVYAEIEGGERVYLEFDETLGWFARSSFAGWEDGSNNFTVVVEEKNRFEGSTLIRGGLVSAGPFQADVSDVGAYPGGVPKKANPTQAPVRNVPGLELPLLAAGLVGTAFIVRRRL